MQEEISNQIVVILKNAGGLTAQALKQAIIKAVIEPENRRAALRQSRRTAEENERLRQRMRQRGSTVFWQRTRGYLRSREPRSP